MSSATQLELTVAEGLLHALDTARGMDTARRLLKDDHLEAPEARRLLERMLEEARGGCPACGADGFAKVCADCGHRLAEADSAAEYATNIGQDHNLPKRVGRKKRRRKKKTKVQEARVVGMTGGDPGTGVAEPWGGANPGADDDGGVARWGLDSDAQPRVGTSFVDAVLARGDELTSPPNLRESTGWESCANCVFFHKMCNLYGWDRDGTPADADVVHRAGWPVDPDDVCDAHTTLSPSEARLVESLDREDGRLAEAARAENAQMVVRARARVARASERLAEELEAGARLPGESAEAYTRRVLVEMWSPAARAAALLARRQHHGPSFDESKVHALKLGERADIGGGYQVHHAPDASTARHSYYVSHNGSPVGRAHSSAAAVQAASEHASPRKLSSKDRAEGAKVLFAPVTEKQRAKGQMKFSSSLKGRPNPFAPKPRLHAALETEAEAQWAELLEVASDAYPGLDRSPKKNWVDKAGGLPRYIERIAKHLHYEKGKEIGHAIAIAVNVVKKMCASGDTNFPGKQSVNAGSRAEACAAVAEWERKKGATSARGRAGNAARAPLQHAAPWDDLGELLSLAEAAYRPVPPSDRFVENLHRELAAAEGRPDWMLGYAILDEADALLERYAPLVAAGELVVGLEEGIVRLFHAPGLAGHWDPIKHPRAPKGRKGGGEFARSQRVLDRIGAAARGGVGGRDRQRGYRHPEGAPAHERAVAEMFDRPPPATKGVAAEFPDRSIMPAERKALASYLRRKGAVSVATKLESSNARLLNAEELRAISTAVRGDGRGIGSVGDKARMPGLAGRSVAVQPLPGDASGRRQAAALELPPPTHAYDATSVEDAFAADIRNHVPSPSAAGGYTGYGTQGRPNQAARGRRNTPSGGGVDAAISKLLSSYPGLKDWNVEKHGEDYHVSVETAGGKHVIAVSPAGETTYISGPQAKELGKAAKVVAGKPKPAQPVGALPSAHPSLADMDHVGNEKPYHMEDGDYFTGHDGVLYQKLESGPKLMMGKNGPLAGVRIYNHKTGTQKIAPAFALSTYYDVYRPKGGSAGSSAVGTDAPSASDLEAQLAASIAGQKGIAHAGGMPSAGTAPKGEKLDVKGKNIVITGVVPGMTRPEAMAKLKAAGAYPQSSVTGATHYLIVGENAGKAKPAAAAKKGAKVVPVSQIMHLLEAELDPRAARLLARLEECSAELREAASPTQVVRLRARRSALLASLGLEERDFSTAQRAKAADKGQALPDGSFPIRDATDLKNARRAVGRAHPSKRAAVRAHIAKRAKALGVSLAESEL